MGNAEKERIMKLRANRIASLIALMDVFDKDAQKIKRSLFDLDYEDTDLAKSIEETKMEIERFYINLLPAVDKSILEDDKYREYYS